jgi:hypothetical protein
LLSDVPPQPANTAAAARLVPHVKKIRESNIPYPY